MSTTQSRLCYNPECRTIDDSEKQKNCMRCSRCREAFYCSKLCQYDHWAVHKRTCKTPAELERVTPTEGPFVLLLSLSDPDLLASVNKHFLSTLRSKICVIQALNARKALRCLADTNLKGVYVADGGINKRENSEVLSSARRMGQRWRHRAVVGSLFPSFYK